MQCWKHTIELVAKHALVLQRLKVLLCLGIAFGMLSSLSRTGSIVDDHTALARHLAQNAAQDVRGYSVAPDRMLYRRDNRDAALSDRCVAGKYRRKTPRR